MPPITRLPIARVVSVANSIAEAGSAGTTPMQQAGVNMLVQAAPFKGAGTPGTPAAKDHSVALTIEMTFAISNEARSAQPSRLRLALLPYNALKKAVNTVFRLERVRSIS